MHNGYDPDYTNTWIIAFDDLHWLQAKVFGCALAKKQKKSSTLLTWIVWMRVHSLKGLFAGRPTYPTICKLVSSSRYSRLAARQGS